MSNHISWHSVYYSVRVQKINRVLFDCLLLLLFHFIIFNFITSSLIFSHHFWSLYFLVYYIISAWISIYRNLHFFSTNHFWITWLLNSHNDSEKIFSSSFKEFNDLKIEFVWFEFLLNSFSTVLINWFIM